MVDRTLEIFVLKNWTPEKVTPEEHLKYLMMMEEKGLGAAIPWTNAAYHATPELRARTLALFERENEEYHRAARTA